MRASKIEMKNHVDGKVGADIVRILHSPCVRAGEVRTGKSCSARAMTFLTTTSTTVVSKVPKSIERKRGSEKATQR